MATPLGADAPEAYWIIAGAGCVAPFIFTVAVKRTFFLTILYFYRNALGAYSSGDRFFGRNWFSP